MDEALARDLKARLANLRQTIRAVSKYAVYIAYAAVLILHVSLMVKNASLMSQLPKIEDTTVSRNCRADFAVNFLRLFGRFAQESEPALSDFTQMQLLNRGVLTLLATSELVSMVLFSCFIFQRSYKRLGYVLVTLISALNADYRRRIAGWLGTTGLRFSLAFFGGFSALLSSTLLELLQQPGQPACVAAAVDPSVFDQGYVWLFLINSLFRGLLLTLVIVAIFGQPLFGHRLAFAEPAEELRQFRTFLRTKLEQVLSEQIELAIIETHNAYFYFRLEPERSFEVYFYGSTKRVIIDLRDDDGESAPAEKRSMLEQFTSQYERSALWTSKRQTIASGIIHYSLLALTLIGLVSGAALYLALVLFHQAWVVQMILAVAGFVCLTATLVSMLAEHNKWIGIFLKRLLLRHQLRASASKSIRQPEESEGPVMQRIIDEELEIYGHQRRISAVINRHSHSSLASLPRGSQQSIGLILGKFYKLSEAKVKKNQFIIRGQRRKRCLVGQDLGTENQSVSEAGEINQYAEDDISCSEDPSDDSEELADWDLPEGSVSPLMPTTQRPSRFRMENLAARRGQHKSLPLQSLRPNGLRGSEAIVFESRLKLDESQQEEQEFREL